MKTLLILVALGTIVASPALAQRTSTAYHHGAQGAHQKRIPTATPQIPGSYYERFPHIWTG
jgi:hypothetical protein